MEHDSALCSGGSGARRLHMKCIRSSPWQQGRKKVHWVKGEQIAFILYLESYSRRRVTDAPAIIKILPAQLRLRQKCWRLRSLWGKYEKQSCFFICLKHVFLFVNMSQIWATDIIFLLRQSASRKQTNYNINRPLWVWISSFSFDVSNESVWTLMHLLTGRILYEMCSRSH